MNKKIFLGLVFTVLAIGNLYGQASGSPNILIDDFETGSKPNKLMGDFGTFDFNPADPGAFCKMSFDSKETHGNSSYSVKLDYDVDSPKPAFNGFWVKLNNFDSKPYSKLSFWIKGKFDAPEIKKIKIELKSDGVNAVYYMSLSSDPNWREIEIPFSQFKGKIDWSALSEFVIVFSDVETFPKFGTIYIDDIYIKQ